MDQDEVASAFDMVLEEIDRAIEALNQEGKQAFKDSKYEIVAELAKKGEQMKAFQAKVRSLRKDGSVFLRPLFLRRGTRGRLSGWERGS